MTIPEEQLETWSHQGPTAIAADTNGAVQRALEAARYSKFNTQNYSVYLQGSYKNNTNIRPEGDVDVVAELHSTFSSDTTRLVPEQVALFHRKYPTAATYQLADFKQEVLSALRAGFGWDAVTEGNKAIRIKEAPGRLPADVLVCNSYRKYGHVNMSAEDEYVPGIIFWTRDEGREVINYPEMHYQNGVAKHQRTNEWFKPTTRIYKNARTHMVDRNLLASDVAPSYFVQCLLYNVPDSKFGSTYTNSFELSLLWLLKADMTDFTCQNGQLPLFGNTEEQWDIEQAKTFLNALLKLWSDWG